MTHKNSTDLLGKSIYGFTVTRTPGRLGRVNHGALDSLKESGEETLTVIRLNVGSVLRRTLLSTNPIESAFSYTYYRVERVKNWRTDSDQVSRW